jgi:hypothetical protein
MVRGDPRQQPTYRYGELSPGGFEGLVFRLAWAEERRVVRLRAPDGGLDTVLPSTERPEKAEHGWQAKRHTRHIDWEDCEASLDRAVQFWEPRRVTFAFPKDLNQTEYATFQRRLAGRHEGVDVDYWGKATLDARLAIPEGRRIAAFFFQEQDATEIAERMLRAGSPLQSGEDFLAAEEAVAQSLALANPDYDWLIHRTGHDDPEPAPSPGAILRLSFGSEDVVIHADLVPRHSSPDAIPSVVLRLDDSPAGDQAREWLEELRKSGGRLAIESAVELSVENVPAPFGDLLGTPLRGPVSLRLVSEPIPFYARVTAGPPEERVSIDIDLLPADPSDEWDASLEGRLGGLTMSMYIRWLVHERQGEFRLKFHYDGGARAPNDVQAQVLKWLLASHRGGDITVEDRRGERPSTTYWFPARPVPDELEVWAQLHADLAELERAAGRPAPAVPHVVEPQSVAAIASVARLLRARSRTLSITALTMEFASAPEIGGIARDIDLRQTMVANVFGLQLPVAREVTRIPPMIVTDREPKSDGGWRVQLVPLSGDEIEASQELIPLSENPR